MYVWSSFERPSGEALCFLRNLPSAEGISGVQDAYAGLAARGKGGARRESITLNIFVSGLQHCFILSIPLLHSHKIKR